MAFDLDKYVVSTTPREVTLPLSYCTTCNFTGLQPDCEDHDSASEEFVELKIKDLPRMRKESILSEAMSWDNSGNTRFKPNLFKNEVLKFIITEAPWGQTSESFLASLGDNALSDALDTLVPAASSSGQSNGSSVEAIKKEQ